MRNIFWLDVMCQKRNFFYVLKYKQHAVENILNEKWEISIFLFKDINLGRKLTIAEIGTHCNSAAKAHEGPKWRGSKYRETWPNLKDIPE